MWICMQQILANRGPNSRFIFEANLKTLWQSLILITQNRVHRKLESQTGSKLPKYHHAFTNTESDKSVILYLHLKNYVFPISLPFPLYQGNTLSLTNVVTSLVDLVTACKKL